VDQVVFDVVVEATDLGREMSSSFWACLDAYQHRCEEKIRDNSPNILRTTFLPEEAVYSSAGGFLLSLLLFCRLASNHLVDLGHLRLYRGNDYE